MQIDIHGALDYTPSMLFKKIVRFPEARFLPRARLFRASHLCDANERHSTDR